MSEAFYFGCWDGPGHYLHDVRGRRLWNGPPDCPWDSALMDADLLRNGKHADKPDGRVWWTVGGYDMTERFWHAFYWWDRSVDLRGGCNSGFYVRGVPWERGASAQSAFDIACAAFPKVVKRQIDLLVLQEPGK